MKRTTTLLFLLLHIVALVQGQSSKTLAKAEAYYALNEYSQAASEFERFLLHHSDKPARIKLAHCYSKCNQQAKALTLYEALVSESDKADTLNLLYAALLKKKKVMHSVLGWLIK